MAERLFCKNIRTGHIFGRTDALMQRPDIRACDVNGVVEDQTEYDKVRQETREKRRVTRFLGNDKTGHLMNYSEVLAERPDMISMDSIEEWDKYLKSKKEVRSAPVLTRANTLNAEPEQYAYENPENDLKSVEIPENDPKPSAMPNIDGLPAREAKGVLATWAQEKHGEKLDKRESLQDLIKACEWLESTVTLNSEAAVG